MEPPTPTLPEPDLLERIVTLVDSAAAPRGFDAPHLLVKVEAAGPDAFDLGLKELPPGSHPVEELWGFVAPPGWLAIGVVTYGWCSPMNEGRPSRHPARRRVRVTALVGRDGGEAATAVIDDGTTIDKPGQGRIGDVLRCCMAVPTAPPPPLSHLVDVLWLLAVAEDPEAADLTWPEVEALRHEPEGVTRTWSGVRALAARSGRWPGATAWMDDGFFARELLATLPSVEELLQALTPRLEEAVLRRIRSRITPVSC